MISVKIVKVYCCNLTDMTIDKFSCYNIDYAKVKRTVYGLRWHKSKRDANLYLAGYLRFLAKVKTHQAQELCAKAYRLTK